MLVIPLRFLRKKSQVATELMKSSIYNPNDLVRDITEQIDINTSNLAGYHIYCFNQIETTEKWADTEINLCSISNSSPIHNIISLNNATPRMGNLSNKKHILFKERNH